MKEFKREIIQLYVCPVTEIRCHSFEFIGGRIFYAPPSFPSWVGISYEEFAERVIEKFGYLWKMVFRTFDGERWLKGDTSVNWYRTGRTQ